MVKASRSEKTRGHSGRHDASLEIVEPERGPLKLPHGPFSNGLSLLAGVLIFVKFVFTVVEILP